MSYWHAIKVRWHRIKNYGTDLSDFCLTMSVNDYLAMTI